MGSQRRRVGSRLRQIGLSSALLVVAACHVVPEDRGKPAGPVADGATDGTATQGATVPIAVNAATPATAAWQTLLDERTLVAAVGGGTPATALAANATIAAAPPAPAARATPTILAVDAVVAELLRAAFTAHDLQRRTALENIANVHTTAYKRRTPLFTTQRIVDGDGHRYDVPVLLRVLTEHGQGVLEVTNRVLDVGIDGDGFFAVTLPDGTTGYTRAGGFLVDQDGKLVTGDGTRLQPEITVPADTLEICIDPDGRVTVRTAASFDTSTVCGRLTLHRFVNRDGLLAIGAQLHRETEASGPPVTAAPGTNGLGTLKQGCLERSNVELARELITLQMSERQHQVLRQVLQQFGMIAP